MLSRPYRLLAVLAIALTIFQPVQATTVSQVLSFTNLIVNVTYEDTAFPGDYVSFTVYATNNGSGILRLNRLVLTFWQQLDNKQTWTQTYNWTNIDLQPNSPPISLSTGQVPLPINLLYSYLTTQVSVTYSSGSTEVKTFLSTRIRSPSEREAERYRQDYEKLLTDYTALASLINFVNNDVVTTRGLLWIFMVTTMTFLGSTLTMMMLMIRKLQRGKADRTISQIPASNTPSARKTSQPQPQPE